MFLHIFSSVQSRLKKKDLGCLRLKKVLQIAFCYTDIIDSIIHILAYIHAKDVRLQIFKCAT